MSSELNKVISGLVNPFTIGMIGLVLAWVLARARPALGRWLFGLSVVWLWAWSTGAMANWIGSSLEDRYPPTKVEVEGGGEQRNDNSSSIEPLDSVSRADAIHILGGGMGINTNDCVYADMWANADRVWQGARLWKAGKAPVIVCSGGMVKESTLPLLKDFGVPEERVVFLDKAKNTEDEGRMVRALGFGKIILVTSAWHMRRAELLFRKASGCEIVPSACDYEVTTRFGKSHKLGIGDFLPNADSLMMNTYLFKEHFAYWCYKWLRGY